MAKIERGRLRFTSGSEMDVEYRLTAGAFEPEVVYGSVITNLGDLDPGVFASKIELLCDAGQTIEIVFTDLSGESTSFMGTQTNAGLG